jgi:DNA invertase Pin-like site-specific DNA recombinase
MQTIPLRPKDPSGPLRVIVLGRLSKPKDSDEQTQATINSSFAFVQEFLGRQYNGKVDVRRLGEQISGMVFDRATIREAEDLINSGTWDLVLAEDLSRIYRNPRHQYGFVQDCVDAGIRLICIADQIDTADENWETMLGTATLRHGLFIPDTRRRIKRTAKYAFHQGGMVQRVRFGYEKLSREQAATGDRGPCGLRIAKRSEAQETFDEIRRRLMSNEPPAAVVRWLNKQQVPPGPYVTRGAWTTAILKDLLTDPLIHGTRQFRKQTYTTILKSGEHRRDPNPEPEREYVSELAFMTRDEQEAMLAAVGWQIKWLHAPPEKGHPRGHLRRTQSFWPGQAAKCGICGGSMVIAGSFLRCTNSLPGNGRACWNHVQAPIAAIRRATWQALHDWETADPAEYEALITAVTATLSQVRSEDRTREDRRQSEIAALQREGERLAEAIARGAALDPLVTRLKASEQRLALLAMEQTHAEQTRARPVAETSPEYVRENLGEALRYLLANSLDFADELRKRIVDFEIFPVQALDSGQVRARGRWRLRFATSSNAGGGWARGFDLFEPPIHIRLVEPIVVARGESPRPTYQTIAKRLETSVMTVKRALAYRDLMTAAATNDPYVPLVSMPQNASRWRAAS